MTRSKSVALILVVTLLLTVFAAAAAPATKPAIPALIVGTAPPKSFIANGICRFSAGAGLGFHVAWDGSRQVCALYDASDGTPLFLSDGGQTLVYDLTNSRIVRVPVSRGYVRIQWNPQEVKPLSFSIGVDLKSDPQKLEESSAWFRIDRFVAATPQLKPLGRQGNSDLFAAERKDGSVESLQVGPPDAGWFRFTSMSGGESFYRIELHATHIDEPLPASALAFPDAKRFPADVNLVDLDQQLLPAFVVFLRDGHAWMTKLAVSGGPTVQDSVGKTLGNVDWAELRERDARFGAVYRKALAEQGVPPYSVAATTRPAG